MSNREDPTHEDVLTHTRPRRLAQGTRWQGQAGRFEHVAVNSQPIGYGVRPKRPGTCAPTLDFNPLIHHSEQQK